MEVGSVCTLTNIAATTGATDKSSPTSAIHEPRDRLTIYATTSYTNSDLHNIEFRYFRYDVTFAMVRCSRVGGR